MRKTADTEDEWLALVEDHSVYIVRSLNDLDEVLKGASAPGAREPCFDGNPLRDVPTEVLRRFRESLIFRDGALGHAEYAELKDSLSEVAFERVWSMFGISMALFADYQDKYCEVGSHTCYHRVGAICTSKC